MLYGTNRTRMDIRRTLLSKCKHYA